MPPHPKILPIIITLLLALTITLPLQAQLQYRPGREYRSLNTGAYEIAIQKNGRVDVALTSGAPVFLNAFPMIWYANKKAPQAIRLDGRYSQRFEVNDPLGRGQGMRIRYKDIQWTLRAYPTKPYLAVQLAYINSSKKPVTIKQLTPWAIGDPNKGAIALGPGTLESIILIDGMAKSHQPLATKNGQAPNMIALLNPQTGRSLIAGFTTQIRALNSLHIQALDQKEADTDHLNYIRATNTYDPPITVQPGQVLESEILYLAITESDPLLALERYAKAIAVTNKIPLYPKSPPRNILFPLNYSDIESVRADLMETIHQIKSTSAESKNIRFILGNVPDSPNRDTDEIIASFARNLHSEGFLVGLLEDPFTYRTTDDISKAHPEWFVSIQTDFDSSIDPRNNLLDVTVPAARDWLEKSLRARQKRIGFDSLWYVDLESYSNVNNPELGTGTSIRMDGIPNDFRSGTSLTKIEIIRLAMNTLRQALPKNTPIILTPTNLLPTFPNTHRLINPDHPSITLRVPHLGRHYALNTTSNYPQAALKSINLIQTPDTPHSLFIPPLIRPAKPHNLFYNNDPDIWLKKGNTPAGRWILAGINNNTSTKKIITLPINNPSLPLQPQFTLFDLQQKRYYGQVQTQVNISVPADQMRTLLLRQYKKVPLLIGTTFPISQTLPDKINERWDPQTLTLTGTLTTTQESGTLYFLQPPRYEINTATLNNTPIKWTHHENTLTLEIKTKPNTPTTYTLTFKTK